MHLLNRKASANGVLKNLDKADYPSTFARSGKMVANAPLNCQNQFFESLSQIISLLEHEWARPENFDFFR
jgi:hypothetical protein